MLLILIISAFLWFMCVSVAMGCTDYKVKPAIIQGTAVFLASIGVTLLICRPA